MPVRLLMSGHLERAIFLMNRSRIGDAIELLDRRLAEDPTDVKALALIASCYAGNKELERGIDAARQAIHHAPASDIAHAALARVLSLGDRPAEARQAIDEAIRLDPADPNHRSLQALILYQLRRWSESLAASEQGLALDPEHDRCAHLRAAALIRLKRHDLAGAAVDEALVRNPDDASSHANRGWALIEAGEWRESLDAFREALRLNPHFEYAESGLLHATKSQFVLYRWARRMLIGFLKTSAPVRWGRVIGVFLIVCVVNGLANLNPEIAPFARTATVCLAGLAILVWICDPLFEILIRFGRFRIVLPRERMIGLNGIAGCCMAACVSLVIAAISGSPSAWRAAGVLGMLVALLGGTIRCRQVKPRRIMAFVTAALAMCGVISAMPFELLSKRIADRISPTLDLLHFAFWVGGFVALIASVPLAVWRPKSERTH